MLNALPETNVPQLIRYFPTGSFLESLTFANQIGALAEEAGHHPAIEIEWGNVTVRWWSHEIAGLHLNDYIMAARTNRLAHLQVDQAA